MALEKIIALGISGLVLIGAEGFSKDDKTTNLRKQKTRESEKEYTQNDIGFYLPQDSEIFRLVKIDFDGVIPGMPYEKMPIIKKGKPRENGLIERTYEIYVTEENRALRQNPQMLSLSESSRAQSGIFPIYFFVSRFNSQEDLDEHEKEFKAICHEWWYSNFKTEHPGLVEKVQKGIHLSKEWADKARILRIYDFVNTQKKQFFRVEVIYTGRGTWRGQMEARDALFRDCDDTQTFAKSMDRYKNLRQLYEVWNFDLRGAGYRF